MTFDLELVRTALEVLVVPIAGFCVKLHTDVVALKSGEYGKKIDTLESTKNDHSTRISVTEKSLESLIEQINKLAPSLADIGKLTTRMEAILEQSTKRLEFVEDELLRRKG